MLSPWEKNRILGLSFPLNTEVRNRGIYEAVERERELSGVKDLGADGEEGAGAGDAGDWGEARDEEFLADGAVWFQEPPCTTMSPSPSCSLGW